MPERIQQLFDRVDALELRQRILLLLGCLAVLFYIADSYAIQPTIKQQKVLRQEITDWESRLNVLRQRSGILPDHPANDTSSAHGSLLSELSRLETQVRERIGVLLSPRQAIEVLERVLEQEQGLRLLQVVAGNRPDEFTDADTADDNTIGRYQMQLHLEGSYMATLRYLKALENLPWKFFWEGVEYEVIEYPTGRITLDLYTLGLLEDAS